MHIEHGALEVCIYVDLNSYHSKSGQSSVSEELNFILSIHLTDRHPQLGMAQPVGGIPCKMAVE